MRVVAGTLASRRLLSVRGASTRPTADRVKEAMFAIVGDVTDKQVIDLYAGTGALGIEALSRGARSCAFVERDREAQDVLRANLQTLDLGSRSTLLAMPVEVAWKRLAPGFDLAFCDPPYAKVQSAVLNLVALAHRRLLSSDALIVLEHGKQVCPEWTDLVLIDHRHYGDTALAFLRPPQA